MRTLPLAVVSVVSLVGMRSAVADKAFERRIYPDEITASSVLAEDSTELHPNDHPNYMADDDAKTSWTEGSRGSGEGERVAFDLGLVQESSRVRLRVRSGCQGSAADFTAHPRPKMAAITLQPSGVTKEVTFADQADWQDVVVEQPADNLESVAVVVRSAYPGTSSTDLCIADVQLFVTSASDDDGWYEKEKHKSLVAWKKARQKTARQFAKDGATLPLLPSYRYEETDDSGSLDLEPLRVACGDDSTSCNMQALLAVARKDGHFDAKLGPALELARRALAGDGTRLVPVQLSAVDRRAIPALDGFQTRTLRGFNEVEHNTVHEGLDLPMRSTIGAFTFTGLRAVALKSKIQPAQVVDRDPLMKECRTRAGVDYAWSVQDPTDAAGGLRAFVVARCGLVQGRDGHYPTSELQVLVYAPSGQLVLVAGGNYISSYEWAQDGSRAVIVGGRRLTSYAARGILRATRDLARQQPGVALAR